MTPLFWKYLITNCDGSAIRFVVEQERDWAEKELEGDPRLLQQPAERVLEQLRRARAQLQRMEVNHMHDAVVTINNTHWPAYRKENGILVDLRLFDPKDRSPKPRLIFRPNALRETGIPEALIEAAARSNPPGLILFEDLPQSQGCSQQPTSQESTR